VLVLNLFDLILRYGICWGPNGKFVNEQSSGLFDVLFVEDSTIEHHTKDSLYFLDLVEYFEDVVIIPHLDPSLIEDLIFFCRLEYPANTGLPIVELLGYGEIETLSHI
jgi:hypothetical protein